MSSPDLRSTWFSDAIARHRTVTAVAPLSEGLVRIERKGLPSITVTALGNMRIDEPLVEAVLGEFSPTAVVLVPRAGHYDWSAREIAMNRGSTILTMKEIFTFLGELDLRTCQDKNVAYNRQLLAQHSRVRECQMICESSMVVRRSASLGDVTIAVEYEYEFSEEAAVNAIGRHPDADIILNANPSGTTTTVAYAHARDVRVPIYGLRELMGALNYDGDRLRNYEAPEMRRETTRRKPWS